MTSNLVNDRLGRSTLPDSAANQGAAPFLKAWTTPKVIVAEIEDAGHTASHNGSDATHNGDS